MGEPGRAPDLNPTSASLLGFLHRGAMTGWDVVQLASTFIGDFWSLTQSQVYRELDALARQGLVSIGDAGPRQRRPFTLTDAGRAAFLEWLHREAGPDHIRMPLLLKLSFGAQMEPEALAALLTAHRRAHEERLAGYRAVLPAVAAATDAFVAATLSCGIHHEEAMVAWFDSLPAEWTRVERPRRRRAAGG